MARFLYGTVTLILVATALAAIRYYRMQSEATPLSTAGLVILALLLCASYIFAPGSKASEGWKVRIFRLFYETVLLTLVMGAYVATAYYKMQSEATPLSTAGLIILALLLFASYIFYPGSKTCEGWKERAFRFLFGTVTVALIAVACIIVVLSPWAEEMKPLTFAWLIILAVLLFAAFIFFPEPKKKA